MCERIQRTFCGTFRSWQVRYPCRRCTPRMSTSAVCCGCLRRACTSGPITMLWTTPSYRPVDRQLLGSVEWSCPLSATVQRARGNLRACFGQIRGEKRVVLFAPSDADFLYMKGDKSEVLDIDAPDLSRFPLFAHARPHECRLRPGDTLFIPALWFHHVVAPAPAGASVAVNVFWRHLPRPAYDSSDPYGNRDPLPAQRAAQQLAAALRSLAELPPDHRDFFARRLAAKLRHDAFLPPSE